MDGLEAAAFDFAGLNSPGHLAQQPEQFISQSHQAQADHLGSGQDPGRNLQPASDLDCDPSAGNTQEVLDYPPSLQAERPGGRAKMKGCDRAKVMFVAPITHPRSAQEPKYPSIIRIRPFIPVDGCRSEIEGVEAVHEGYGYALLKRPPGGA